jgi:hypothetical protein
MSLTPEDRRVTTRLQRCMEDRFQRIRGSSYLRWVWPVDLVESAADEEHPQSVVVSIVKASGDAPVELDQPVDRLGAAVGGTVGEMLLDYIGSRPE